MTVEDGGEWWRSRLVEVEGVGGSNESEMWCWLELCCEVDWRGEARWW